MNRKTQGDIGGKLQGPRASFIVCYMLLFGATFIVSSNGPLESQEVERSDPKLVAEFVRAAGKYTAENSQFGYRSQSNGFGHLQRPWATRQRKFAGIFSITPERLAIVETTEGASSRSEKRTFYSADTLYQCDEKGQADDITEMDHRTFLRNSCRYTPRMLLSHVLDSFEASKEARTQIEFSVKRNSVKRNSVKRNSIKRNSIKRNSIKETSVKQKGDGLVVAGMHGNEDFEIYFSASGTIEKIVWLSTHEMWGDQRIEFEYTSEKVIGNLPYPSMIKEKTFGETTFQTEILAEAMLDLLVPKDYKLQPDKQTDRVIEVDKHSEHVTFLHLPHCESRTTLVEFRDFLMVIDAPKSSANGKLILDKIAELRLGKPVKYFTFGHHHPHYLGGVRPFVAAGTTILTTKKIAPYIKQVVDFEHSRQPDELQLNPRGLSLKTFEHQMEISDGEYAVQIFDIGLKSKHTIDYLLCYFPKEKMVLQGDGIWIREGQPANARTKATYQAIVDLNLDVVDCIQGWPTQGYGVPTKVKFAELEKAVADKE